MNNPTCTHCGSRKTIKYGWPKWLCKKCKRTFRRRRKDIRDRKAIEAYVKDRSTYERLGERWKVSRSTAWRRVKKAFARRCTLLERTKSNLSSCDGVLSLDGKHVRIKGKGYCIFVAWDRRLGKPVHFILAEGGEKELWYWRLLLDLKRIGYRPKAFVSDGLLTLKEFLSEQYPDLPHQRCAVHVFLSARGKLSGGKSTSTEVQAFIESIRDILWSKNLLIAKRKCGALYRANERIRKRKAVLELVWKALPECFVCCDPKWKHLNLPRSSNSIENVIGQIEARLKTIRGSKSESSLNRLINEVLLGVKKQCIR